MPKNRLLNNLLQWEKYLFPAPALPVSGSKGMFSARNIKAPPL